MQIFCITHTALKSSLEYHSQNILTPPRRWHEWNIWMITIVLWCCFFVTRIRWQMSYTALLSYFQKYYCIFTAPIDNIFLPKGIARVIYIQISLQIFHVTGVSNSRRSLNKQDDKGAIMTESYLLQFCGNIDEKLLLMEEARQWTNTGQKVPFYAVMGLSLSEAKIFRITRK